MDLLKTYRVFPEISKYPTSSALCDSIFMDVLEQKRSSPGKLDQQAREEILADALLRRRPTVRSTSRV